MTKAEPRRGPFVTCIECYLTLPLSQADVVAMGYLCGTCSRLARTPVTEGGRPLLHAQPHMVLECPRAWGSLAQTTDPNVRHCGSRADISSTALRATWSSASTRAEVTASQ